MKKERYLIAITYYSMNEDAHHNLMFEIHDKNAITEYRMLARRIALSATFTNYSVVRCGKNCTELHTIDEFFWRNWKTWHSWH